MKFRIVWVVLFLFSISSSPPAWAKKERGLVATEGAEKRVRSVKVKLVAEGQIIEANFTSLQVSETLKHMAEDVKELGNEAIPIPVQPKLLAEIVKLMDLVAAEKKFFPALESSLEDLNFSEQLDFLKAVNYLNIPKLVDRLPEAIMRDQLGYESMGDWHRHLSGESGLSFVNNELKLIADLPTDLRQMLRAGALRAYHEQFHRVSAAVDSAAAFPRDHRVLFSMSRSNCVLTYDPQGRYYFWNFHHFQPRLVINSKLEDFLKKQLYFSAAGVLNTDYDCSEHSIVAIDRNNPILKLFKLNGDSEGLDLPLEKDSYIYKLSFIEGRDDLVVMDFSHSDPLQGATTRRYFHLKSNRTIDLDLVPYRAKPQIETNKVHVFTKVRPWRGPDVEDEGDYSQFKLIDLDTFGVYEEDFNDGDVEVYPLLNGKGFITRGSNGKFDLISIDPDTDQLVQETIQSDRLEASFLGY